MAIYRLMAWMILDKQIKGAVLGSGSRRVFHPIKSFGELKEQLGKRYLGVAPWQKVTEAARKNTNQNAVGCFVAGTLVHTRDGLRPIEQIQVGDYVLSKPEDGNGETAYKRVVNTFEFADKEAWFVSWQEFHWLGDRVPMSPRSNTWKPTARALSSPFPLRLSRPHSSSCNRNNRAASSSRASSISRITPARSTGGLSHS